MNYSVKRFIFLSILSLSFLINLSAQDISIEEVCACQNGSEISEFVITFGNWPTDPAEKYEIVINYSVEGGNISSVSKTNIFGSPSARIEVTFSSINNPSDPGGLQIERVTQLSSNTNESVSSDFVNYESSNEVVLTPPADTTIASCLLGGANVADLFDDWLSNVIVSGGCGNIDVTNNWNGIYPSSCEETISVTFTARDVSCGDTATGQAIFTVEDCKAPVPVTVNDLVSVELRPGFCKDVNVNVFDAGSFDDCGEVKLSYSKDVSDTLRTFCCDIYNNNERKIEFWVTDESGNQDYVVTYLFTEGCEHSHGIMVSGNIATHEGRGVENVEVVLENLSSSTQLNQLTRTNGFYTFRDIELDSPTDFQLKPTKNDDVLNGVSTFDILLIQRHILGLTPIRDPYKLIAANINGDQRISGADLIDLRRAILGIDSGFSNNNSWRFVDATHMLQEGEVPMNYPEDIQFRISNNSKYNKDFVAVKIGDIDGSAATNIYDSTEAEGNNSALRLAVPEENPERGEMIELDVTSDNFSAVSGFQFTLDYDLDALEFAELKGGRLEMGESNYAYFSEAGTLTLSWNCLESENYNSDEVLFTLAFRAKDQSALSDALQFTDAITKSEAYIGGETRKLSLRFLQRSKKFALYQNAPNPFDSETIIKFDLPESGPAVLTIYDSAGKVVFVVEGEYSAGPNQVQIDRGDLPVQDLYFYELRSGEHRATKKMVVAGK